ncbi:MAG TPA: sigma-70 family RNA polymerase sigma factor [Thermoanaerobaculia bacterium]|nr:sigma-70 family RNA polymerase sigma factor [Thermoanaerobaculia bacterium]
MDDWYAFDDDYVRRLREGDPWTIRHFFRYFDPLLTIKLRSRLRPDVVEDGKQIVYVRVLEAVKAGKIRDGKAFGAFVSRTGDHVSQELLRTNGRTDPLEDKHLGIPSPHSTDELLIDHETQERVHKTLAELTDRDRDLLVRSFLREDTTAELCEQFQVKPEYLRVLLFRARQRFRSHYETGPPKKLPPDEMEKP